MQFFLDKGTSARDRFVLSPSVATSTAGQVKLASVKSLKLCINLRSHTEMEYFPSVEVLCFRHMDSIECAKCDISMNWYEDDYDERDYCKAATCFAAGIRSLVGIATNKKYPGLFEIFATLLHFPNYYLC